MPAVLVTMAVSATVSAAETRVAPLIAPDAFCRAMGKMVVKPTEVGVTQVGCDALGRPAVVSGRAPTMELYRLEYLYGRSGPAERLRVNGGEPVSLVPMPDVASVLERMKEAQARGQAQRMEMCPSGEVVVAGDACGSAKEGVPVVGFCAYNVCYGDSYMLGSQNGRIHDMSLMDIDRLDRDIMRQWMVCMWQRDAQLSSCSEQYGNASLACKPLIFFGAAAEFACEIGMAAMNQFCTSLAPTC